MNITEVYLSVILLTNGEWEVEKDKGGRGGREAEEKRGKLKGSEL